jgi:hypothetical protein
MQTQYEAAYGEQRGGLRSTLHHAACELMLLKIEPFTLNLQPPVLVGQSDSKTRSGKRIMTI